MTGLPMNRRLLAAFFATVLLAGRPSAPEPSIAPEDAAFFQDKVLPILRTRCFECHAHDTEINGGLALDVRSGWQQGGKSGPAVIPGKPEESLLVAAVRRSKPDYEMPPDEPLPAAEVATLVEWVARGAPDPRKATAGEAGGPPARVSRR